MKTIKKPKVKLIQSILDHKLKFILLVLLIVFALFFLNKHNVLKGFTPSDVKEYVMTFGAYAPLLYIVLFTFVPLTLFPDSILAIASGMIFGLVQGFIYTMIGALCGATLAFFLARFLGKDILQGLFKKKLDQTDLVSTNGFIFILMLRLIPLFPFDVISYSAGLSNIKYKSYLPATMLGIIPGIFVFTNIGNQSLNINSSGFYISISLLILLVVASFIIKKKYNFNKTC